ncbi:MAG: phosphopentomutase [Gemmatimonadaceae bacterium]|nr:phosphopentomutase [Gemmatimonadaceae bacterium]
MKTDRRAAIVVLDGVGCGGARDADTYGDTGSDTLGNLSRAVAGFALPNLREYGLGNLASLAGVPPAEEPLGAWGVMEPRSAGKDSTTGHWEIAGVHLARAFRTYPHGFPAEVLAEFERRTGRPVIGNVVASGTVVIERFAEEHRRTGAWIVYTSADSVFQIAAHEDVVPLDELYAACAAALDIKLNDPDGESPLVSRVIARPFEGGPGSYRRTANRRDFSVEPPSETLLDALGAAGIDTAGVGKVDDLFAGRSISARHTSSNAEGLDEIRRWIAGDRSGLLLANLVDFDQLYGHRNDVAGFYQALLEFDEALPGLVRSLKKDDLLFITADHGNDPTTPSTDHSRECVPLLAAGSRVRPASIGRRETFSDLGATVAEWLGVEFRGRGTSFLPQIIQ